MGGYFGRLETDYAMEREDLDGSTYYISPEADSGIVSTFNPKVKCVYDLFR
jgi:hypothetical protein